MIMCRAPTVVVFLLLATCKVHAWLDDYKEVQERDLGQFEHALNEGDRALAKRSTEPKPISIAGKPTEQSSTHGSYTSDRAADGHHDTNMFSYNSCTHTLQENNPWWRVDLGDVHCVGSVVILNRGDCCSERLTNAVVRAGTNPTLAENEACGSPVTATQAQPRGGTIELECGQPLRARYVSVDIPGTAVLQLCEVTVKELPLDHCPGSIEPQPLSIVGKATRQSSTLNRYTSNRAADGSRSTNMFSVTSCSHTNQQRNPWWRVDLGGVHCISNIAILNRGDCCSERLTNAVVRAGTNPSVTNNEACGSPVAAAQAQPRGGTIELECGKPLRARYVSVDIPGTAVLQLCEVTVKELPLDKCPAPRALSIVGNPTKQSSTMLQYTSDKAADGSRTTALYPGFRCSHTVSGANDPWWRVDLEGEHCISKVTILNRGDCCSERLTNAVVRAGTSPTVTDNEACGSPVTAAQAQPRGGTIELECGQPLRARYVSVDIPGSATLQLCEVTVEEMVPGFC